MAESAGVAALLVWLHHNADILPGRVLVRLAVVCTGWSSAVKGAPRVWRCNKVFPFRFLSPRPGTVQVSAVVGRGGVVVQGEPAAPISPTVAAVLRRSSRVVVLPAAGADGTMWFMRRRGPCLRHWCVRGWCDEVGSGGGGVELHAFGQCHPGTLSALSGHLAPSLRSLALEYSGADLDVSELRAVLHPALATLRRLCLTGCVSLTSLPAPLPHSLRVLSISACQSLTRLPWLPPTLRRLSLVSCRALRSVGGGGGGGVVPCLDALHLDGCPRLSWPTSLFSSVPSWCAQGAALHIDGFHLVDDHNGSPARGALEAAVLDRGATLSVEYALVPALRPRDVVQVCTLVFSAGGGPTRKKRRRTRRRRGLGGGDAHCCGHRALSFAAEADDIHADSAEIDFIRFSCLTRRGVQRQTARTRL